MKNKRKIGKIAAILAIVFVAICGMQLLLGYWLLPGQIQRVEFRGFDSCEAPATQKVALNIDEIRKFTTLYCCSFYAGQVNAQGCPSDFGFDIYLTDGRHIIIREAGGSRLEVTTSHGQHWIKSSRLAAYAQELMETYNLA